MNNADPTILAYDKIGTALRKGTRVREDLPHGKEGTVVDMTGGGDVRVQLPMDASGVAWKLLAPASDLLAIEDAS